MNNIHPYEIEADWMLLNTCNFRCEYCFEYFKDARAEKIIKYAEPSEWANAFSQTGKTWLLNITGGEPTLYPGFTELCKALTNEGHYISINSNLSNRAEVDRLIYNKVKSINYINAALHYFERKNRYGVGAIEEFCSSVMGLRDAGYSVFVSCLMSPEVITHFNIIEKELARKGIIVIPKAMRTILNGKTYPNAYTDEQRILFNYANSIAKSMYDRVVDSLIFSPTVDMFIDAEKFLYTTPDYIGRPCEAGRKFVMLNPNGLVQNCEHTSNLGNILIDPKNIKFNTALVPCSSSNCPYFCEKYSISR